jgi:hypothetical protein
MKIWHCKPTLAVICLAPGAALLAALPAMAQFEPDTHQVFVSRPGLLVEPPEDGAKYEVLKVVDTGSPRGTALYIITYNDNGRIIPVGTFNCSQTFEIMQTSTNGLYDIVCVQENKPDDLTVFYLKGEPSGNYSINLGK